MATSPHFCRGDIAVAFVFSAPGDEERRQGRPVAGDTGTNLELALGHLHAALPKLFRSVHRYDYRITNAWPETIAAALGHPTSEGSDAQIRDPDNVRRVLQELEGCNLVVLSGNKAKLLAEAIRASGRQYVEVPHVGNKGLNRKYTVPVQLGSASEAVRREYRVRLWADAVVQAITSDPGKKRRNFAVDTTGNGPTDKQREKRRGIAAESLVASMCVLGSDGELNFATSLVDDEGVDLVFYRSAGGPTLSVQVKSHFFDAPEKIERRGMNTLLKPTFRARRDLYLLFLVVDQYEARIQTAWLVPSVEFSESKTGKNLRFQASPDRDSGSPWAHRLVDPLTARETANRIMSALEGLE